MPHEDYMKALKAGRKDYHLHLSRGEYPYLQVLDEIPPSWTSSPR